MKYLIDSDWVADYLRGRSQAVDLLNRLSHDGLAISAIRFGEIYEGIYYGVDPVRSEAVFQQFLLGSSVLDVDSIIARQFAMLRGFLRQRGLLIPQPDILIAATAIEFDLTLVTRNLRHFLRMPGLRLYDQSER